MKDIILYNHFHNGDVFYSRVLIEHLKQKYKIYYYHNLSKPLFEDMPEVVEITGMDNTFPTHFSDFTSNKINTWIGQSNFKYLNSVNTGCSWENYSSLYKDIFSELEIDIKFDDTILPKIYYDKLPSFSSLNENIDDLRKKYQKIVLISNGDVQSGQSPNFNFNNTIENIAELNENILYLISQNFATNKKNILFTSEITNKKPDLLEIGFVSTKCDIIVGRASGPYCFSQNEDNLLNKDKKFICFSNTYNEGKYYNDMKSEFIWSSTSDINEVYNILKTNIL